MSLRGVRLNIEGLRRRLNDLGVDIPERTLRDWASTGFITGPILATQKTRRKLGRPPRSESTGEKNKIAVKGAPGRRYEWPEAAVFEAAASWALRHLNPQGGSASKETIRRVKTLVSKFFENAAAVEYREDYSLDGTKRAYFSSYDIDPLFRTYLIAYEKASNKVPLTKRVRITYYFVPLHCRANNFDTYPLWKIVDVRLEHVAGEQDFLALNRIEPWEYIDPNTEKPYKIDWDTNNCQKFVKALPNGERFLKYIVPSDR